MRRSLKTHSVFFVLLGIGWILFAGALQWPVAAVGTVIVLMTMVVFPSLYADVLSLTPVRRFGRFVGFLGYMLWAIITASLSLSILAVRPSVSTCTRVVRYDYTVDDRLGVLLLATTITLTPGTLVLDIDTGRRRLYIHNLDRQTATADDMVASVRRIEDRLLRVFA